MKAQYVDELCEGVRVDSLFCIGRKEMRVTKTGDTYLSLELTDRSGRIPGVWFDPGSRSHAVLAGTVARVRGMMTSYRGTRRVRIEQLDPVERFDAEDMLAAGVQDRTALVAEMKALAARVRNPHLRSMLRSVFGDEVFFARFSECPGSRSEHHAYLGGLLEHSVAVASICAELATRYPLADADLLLTAALLHDIGMVDALMWRTTIECTDEGRLIGHSILGERRVLAAVVRMKSQPPPGMITRLCHTVLVHHANREANTQNSALSLESLLLRSADELDVQTTLFVQSVSGAAAAHERWSDAPNAFDCHLHVPGPEAAVGLRTFGGA
jgi:3'-5' exoribonuclease